MQLESTSIPRAIAKLLKRRASISSLARSRGFCQNTKNTALLLLKYTIKTIPMKLLWRVTNAYKNFKVTRAHKWTRTSTQDLEIRRSRPSFQLTECKISAPPPKRTSCLKESWALTRTFVTYVLKFTKEEDDFLKEGITKHGFGQWTAILRDDDFQFQDGRTADSLKKSTGMKIALASCGSRQFKHLRRNMHLVLDLLYTRTDKEKNSEDTL